MNHTLANSNYNKPRALSGEGGEYSTAGRSRIMGSSLELACGILWYLLRPNVRIARMDNGSGWASGGSLWAIEMTRKKDVLQWICLDIIEERREWLCGSAAVSARVPQRKLLILNRKGYTM
jgi:hypothetical protein